MNFYKRKDYHETNIVDFKDPVKTLENILVSNYNLNSENNKKPFHRLDYIRYFNDIYNNHGSFFITSIYPYGKDFIISLKAQDGSKHNLYIQDFFPYFFASYNRKVKYIEKYTDKSLITYRHPGFTKKIREKFPNTFEADILYDIRFNTTLGWWLKKKNYLSTSIHFRKWYCDIEVYVKNRERTFDPTCEDNFINVINIFDDNDYILYTILLNKKDPHKEIKDKLVVGNSEITNIIINCQSEKEILYEFFTLYKEKQPDFLFYWNAPYDTNFIYHKTLKYIEDFIKEIKLIDTFFDENNLDKNYFFEDKDYINDVSIYHLITSTTLDLLILYKTSSETREEYTLDYISLIELGEEIGGKVKYEGTLEELYDKDLKTFLDYSRKDAYLLYLIDKQLSLSDKFIGLSYISLLPLRYFNRDYSTKLSDCIYIQYLLDNKLCMITKSQNKEKEKYVGAHVHLPIPGIYGWFCDLDASSMYPSIIISANISIDTFMFYFKDVLEKVKENNEEKLTVKKDLVEKIRKFLINGEYDDESFIKQEFTIVDIHGEEKKMTLEKIRDYLYKTVGLNNFVMTPAGVIFRNDVKGSMPNIMEKLINTRKYYKQLKKLGSKTA